MYESPRATSTDGPSPGMFLPGFACSGGRCRDQHEYGRGRDGIPGRQIPEVLRRACLLGAGRDELLAHLDGDLVGAPQHAN
jgi:hypothetical protein